MPMQQTSEMQEDQSPKVYPATLRQELGTASKMNLEELAYTLHAMSDELPSINSAFHKDSNGRLKARGLFMAIAFEAGRRYGVRQAIGLIPEVRDKKRVNNLITG